MFDELRATFELYFISSSLKQYDLRNINCSAYGISLYNFEMNESIQCNVSFVI